LAAAPQLPRPRPGETPGQPRHCTKALRAQPDATLLPRALNATPRPLPPARAGRDHARRRAPTPTEQRPSRRPVTTAEDSDRTRPRTPKLRVRSSLRVMEIHCDRFFSPLLPPHVFPIDAGAIDDRFEPTVSPSLRLSPSPSPFL
jgi:hypothetical protein